MKNKYWTKIEAVNGENCKHENMCCGDCGTLFIRMQRFTKAKQKEINKLAKMIRETEEENESI